MGKCGCFFSARLISRGKSHISRVRGLVVRCLLFNPEVSCSQKVLTFFGTMRLFGFVRFFSIFFKCLQKVHRSLCLISCNRMNVEKSQTVPFFRFFGTMRLPLKFLIFCFFFRKFFIKDCKEPLQFLKFCNRMDVKKSQRVPSFTVSGIVTFFKRNNFRIKIIFFRSGTLYPIFVVLKIPVFFLCDFLKNFFTEAPPQFLPETKRFARVEDSSRFSALCDLPETIKNVFENFFPQFSVF